MGMDTRRRFDEQESEIPSKAMQSEFKLWEEEYTVDALSDLTSSQIKSKKWRFKNRVDRLVREHNPGRLVEQDSTLAHISGKPAYTAQEWKQAREMIWQRAERVETRFERAEGIVRQEEQESKQEWYVRLVEAALPDSIKLR